jgi:hypothetical protein
MLLGEFERAWQESDRWSSSFGGRRPSPRSRVLVRCMRGFGDAIQFLRYAGELRRQCAALQVQAPARLIPLLAHLPGIDAASDIPPCDFDYEIECSDLPYLFRTTIATIPDVIPYIELSPDLRDRPACLRKRHKLNVGLVWAAGEWNPVRSIPFMTALQLTEIPGIQLFSLQRGPEAAQLRCIPTQNSLVDAEADTNGILDTVRTILDLDLVISVDTMVAHLAGALGRPVWTLLPYGADWRWLIDRSDTPWYPTMRLFRQPEAGNWHAVLEDVRAKLDTYCLVKV